MSIDGDHTGQGQGPQPFFRRDAEEIGDDRHRFRRRDTLIARSGIGHSRESSTTHAGIGRGDRADLDAMGQIVC